MKQLPPEQLKKVVIDYANNRTDNEKLIAKIKKEYPGILRTSSASTNLPG